MRRYVIFISLLLILTAFTTQTRSTKTFSKVKTPKTIALIHHKYLYFIRLKLNNKDANFLLDTGAASSLLDINQANDYNFKINKTDLRFAGTGGLSYQYRITNYVFHHESDKLFVYPLGADLKFVIESFENEDMSVAGVIGSDFLRSHDAIIDYKNEKLIIHK